MRGNNCALLTVSLFWEPWSQSNPDSRAQDQTPIFTLGNDRDGLVSFRKTFLELRDPTGVQWAEIWLEGVNHLNRLMQTPWFSEAFETVSHECEQLLQAEGLQKVREIATGASPAAFQAAKYLASRDWKKAARGRPSASEVKGALKKEVERMSQHDDDLARISPTHLKVVK